MRPLPRSWGCLLLCLALLPALAQAWGKPAKPLRAAPQPFGLVLGTTTAAQAVALLSAEGARETGRGLVDARPGSSGDNEPDGIPNPRAVLVELEGLPLPGLERARLGFFDDRLYSLQYRFGRDHDGAALLRQLVAKYGEPDEASDFDRRYEWRFDGVTLSFSDPLVGADTLVFAHPATLAAVAASSRAHYENHVRESAAGQRGF